MGTAGNRQDHARALAGATAPARNGSAFRRCCPASRKFARQSIRRAQTLTHGRTTVLFVDEVHRFNKAQQDAFLPHVEAGTVVFIGATTENPSFEVIGALLSRVRVYVLKRLEESRPRAGARIARLPDRDRGLEIAGVTIADDARALLLASADGDARRMLNVLEIAAQLIGDDKRITASSVADVIGARQRRFDKQGDVFYDQISALAQGRARHRARRGVVLVVSHARRRMRSGLHRAARRANGERRHRQRRSARIADRARGVGRVPASRIAGRRTGDCAGRALSRVRTEEQRGVYRRSAPRAPKSRRVRRTTYRCVFATRRRG